MKNETTKKLSLEERKFLHQVLDRVAVAHSMSSFVFHTLSKNEADLPREKRQMEKAIGALDDVIALVRDRRDSIRKSLSDSSDDDGEF